MNFLSSLGSISSATAVAQRVVGLWARKEAKATGHATLFVLDDKPVTELELGRPDALMPVFVWQAEALYRHSMREDGLRPIFEEDSGALLGRKVDLDRSNRSLAEALCFLLEALVDARNHLPRGLAYPESAELRSLVNGFIAEMGLQARPASAPPVLARLGRSAIN